MFSELVDEVSRRSGRTEKINDIVGMVNAILRRIHGEALFDRDFITACAIPDHEKCAPCSVVWKRPKDFRVLRTAKVGAKYMRHERVGRNLEGRKFFYYAEGNHFVFQTGDFSCQVDIGYYRKPIMFVYYSSSERPAVFDRETCEFTYKVPVKGETGFVKQLMSDDEQLQAQEKVYDWILEEYPEVVIQGALNLLYVQQGDERAGGTYALYTELLKDVLRNEGTASTNN